MADEKTSYSAEELQEFREIIDRKLQGAREEYAALKESLDSSNDAVDGDNYLSEMGTDMLDKEQVEMLMARTAKFIDGLERALVRIENGTYGRDKNTGKLIPKERLRVVPHTESSMESKQAQQGD